MTIARRLQLLIFLSIASIFLLSIYALGELKETRDRGQFIVDNTLPSYETLYALEGKARTLNALSLRHLIYDSTEDRAATERDIADIRKGIDADLARYEKGRSNGEDRAAFDTLKAAVKAYLGVIDSNLDLVRTNRLEEARAALKEAPVRGLIAAVDADISVNRKAGDEFNRNSKTLYQHEITWLLAGGVVATLLSAGLGWSTYRAAVGALVALRNAAHAIADKLDFTQRAPVLRQDEAGATAAAFNQMVEKVQGSLAQIQHRTGEVGDAAASLAAAATQVSSGSSYQSDAASHMAASVEQMTVSISHVASRAGDTNELVESAGRAAAAGEAVIGAAVAEIHAIEQAIGQAARDIAELESNSTRISAVVTVIREVAEQTNLLALNAAIEAARAGEEGRGFAVVADEVRKLAERTSSSTQEISQSIAAMQESARNSVQAITAVGSHVAQGVGHAQAASEAIGLIGRSTRDSVKAVAEINDTIREQTNAMTSIAQQVEKIAQMTEENSAAAGTTAGTAGELDGIAGKMQAVVAEFRIA